MFGIIPRMKEKRVERFWPYEPPMELLRREPVEDQVVRVELSLAATMCEEAQD